MLMSELTMLGVGLMQLVFRLDASVVLQSRLTHTLIKSANTGLTVEGLAPLLDHVNITGSGNAGIYYTTSGWGLLKLLDCDVSNGSNTPLSLESYYTDAAVYLDR